MPRSSDYLFADGTYHLTHRCHNRDFHLRFGRERNIYQEWLREAVGRYRVSVFDFCITCNHTHAIVRVDDPEATSSLMQLAAGATAKQYNLRKEHLGSVWEHPFQCTLIEDGEHLWNCLCYVALNMPRTGRVMHPREWRWCGYHELVGQRQRYRLLDRERLLQTLGVSTLSEFQQRYMAMIDHRLQTGKLKRESHWTEALAVGSKDFVERACQRYLHRLSFTIGEVAESPTETWTVREHGSAYNAFSATKTHA